MFKKIFNVPAGRKERSRESLPKAPEGMAWLQDERTREWKLVPREDLPQSEEPAANTITSPTKEDVDSHLELQMHQEDPSEVTVDFEAQKEAFANPFHVPTSNHNVITKEEEDLHKGLSAAPPPKPLQQAEEPPSPPQTTHVVINMPASSSRSSSSSHHTNYSFTDHPYDEEGESKTNNNEDDWDLISDDRHSGSNKDSNSIAFVMRNGSIRSSSQHYTSFSGGSDLECTAASDSTIDSQDLLNLGPSGKGILGVDYVEHVILPTDTLQGICLAYKVSASRLKRANHFSGDSLVLAPKKLVIPISKTALKQGYLRVQDTDSKEYKLHAFQATFPQVGFTEAKA
jgi:LysM repeat protein